MQKVLTAEQMREVDRLTTERYGIPSILLMENAARAVTRVITEKMGGSVEGKSLLILCGRGNNGGDGAAMARILHEAGARVEVYIFGKIEDSSGDAGINFKSLAKISSTDFNSKGNLYLEIDPLMDPWVRTTGSKIGEFNMVVDALFGTGLTRPLDRMYRKLAYAYKKKNESKATILLSVDMPSGLFSDDEREIEIHFESDVTVAFTSPKRANVLPPASRSNGELLIADIGSPQALIDEQQSDLYLADSRDAVGWLKNTEFSSDSYKNKRGHALIIAGSENYTGAAVMTGNAAMRSGVGLTTLCVPASCKSEVASRSLPEVIVRTIREDDKGDISPEAFAENREVFDGADSITVGPGLSATDAGARKLVHEVVAARKVPVLIDAGALWFFNPPDGIPKTAEGQPPLILTPHEGEFIRLLGSEDKKLIDDRVAAVRDFAVKNNVILVLKGERVLIGEPGGMVVVNPTGNSGLGKAGNGDTLSGILAGFLAQAVRMDIDVFETVVAAVYIAGMAGDIAEKKYGKRVMTASDVRECLSEAFAACEPVGASAVSYKSLTD